MKPPFLHYRRIIQWSEDDEAYVAEVPALPGCVGVGSTTQQAEEELTIAMELWLDNAVKHGDPIPKPDLPGKGLAP